MTIAVVEDHCGRSNSCVSDAKGIEQQGSSANARVRIRAVEDQRSSADASIEAGSLGAEERTPTDSCVTNAGGEEVKRIASFRCREPGIAPVRRWNDRLRVLDKRKADECKCD